MKQESIETEDNFAISTEIAVKRESITEYESENLDTEVIPKKEPNSDNLDEKSPPFVCQICFKSCPNKRALNDHGRAHKSATIKCNICNKLFKENSLLVKHVKMVHEAPHKPPVKPEDRYCRECDKQFPTGALLTKHSKQRHGERSFTCSVCPMSFVLKHHVRRHEELIHKIGGKQQVDGITNEKKDLCLDLDSVDRSEVIEELIIETKSEPELASKSLPKRVQKKSATKCEICQKVLSTKTQLRLHVERMHSDRQSRKRTGWNLKYHPDESGLFHCDECGKSFTSRAHISGHVMKHKSIQERRFYCEPCDRPFSTKDNLRIHEERAHGLNKKKVSGKIKQEHGENQLLKTLGKSWHCEECDKSFQKESLYKIHTPRHNSSSVAEVCEEDENGLWTCSECGKVFDNKKFYQSHKRRHNAKKQGWYKCNYCDMHCGSKPDLDRHKQVHVDGSGPRVTKYIRGENGLFNCEECDKSFESRNQFCSHVLTHKYVRERRFVCEPCDKAYGTKYALRRHEKDVHGKNASGQNAEKD